MAWELLQDRMLRRWVAGDCRETPHELCEILARQYSPNIRAFFRGWEK